MPIEQSALCHSVGERRAYDAGAISTIVAEGAARHQAADALGCMSRQSCQQRTGLAAQSPAANICTALKVHIGQYRSGAMCHLSCVPGYIAPWSRHSSLGGMFVLEAYTPQQLRFGTGGPPDVDMFMTLDALRVELAGLELILQRDCEREVHEGKLHNGMSAVVQVVARKP